jgi:small-conductance mechanosensitive channel
MIVAAVSPVTIAQQANVCGDPNHENWLCRQVLRVTGNEDLAEVADAIAVPLRIVLVLLIAWIVTRVFHRVIRRMVTRIRDQGSLSLLGTTARLPMSEQAKLRRAQRAATISSVLRNVVTTIVWSVATLIVLGELGIDLAPLIATAGVAGVALAFGTQTIVRDYLAGLFVVLEDQYGVGDEIDAGSATGTVEFVSLRMTRLRDADGVAWYVPNGEIKRVANFSQRRPPPGQPDAERDDDVADDRPNRGTGGAPSDGDASGRDDSGGPGTEGTGRDDR